MQLTKIRNSLIGIIAWGSGALALAQVDAVSGFGRRSMLDAILNGAVPLFVFTLCCLFWWLLKNKPVAGHPGVSIQERLAGFNWLPFMVAGTVCCAGLVITAAAVKNDINDIYASAQLRFQRQVERLELEVQQQFDGVLTPLKGVRGTILASDYLNRREFRTFVQSNDVVYDFPGVLGMGLIDPVAPGQLPAYVAAQKKDGYPTFAVTPGADKAQMLVLRFVEPENVFNAKVGFDVGTIEGIKSAALRAQASGNAALSPPVQWSDEPDASSALLYLLPIYAQPGTSAPANGLTSDFQGWAFVALSVKRMMDQPGASTLGLINFRLYFDANATSAVPLFESVAAPVKQGEPPLFSTSKPMLIGGELFRLQASTTEEFEIAANLGEPSRIALRGATLSILLSFVLWVLLVSRSKAVLLANSMTADLRRMALVAEATNNSVVMLDLQRKIVWTNEGFTRLTGFEAQEAMGHSPWELLHSRTLNPEVIEKIISESVADKGGRYQLLNRRKDRQLYWGDLDLRPMHDTRGTVTGFLVVETDISAEIFAKNALALEKERSDILLSGTNVGTWQSNLKDKEFLFSDRWADMLGFSSDEILPSSDVFFLQRVHPDDRSRVTNLLQQCLSGRQDAFAIELRVAHKSGDWVWILSRAKVISRDASGRVVWIGGVHTDITEAKRLEFSLRDTELFLERAGRLTGLGVWSVDLRTQATTWSDQACQVFGLEQGQEPSIVQALQYFHPDEIPAINEAIDRAIQLGMGWDITARFVNTNAKKLWVRFAGEPEFDDSGAVRLVGAIQDVTRDKESLLRIENSEAVLRGSIDAINEAYVLYDAEDRLVYCNDKYREMYAESAEFMVAGASFESIVRGGVSRGQIQDAKGRVEEWIQERIVTHRSANVTTVQNLSDGRWVRVVDRRMANGHIVGFRIDITELKQAIESAHASADSLKVTTRTLQAVLDSAVDVGIMAMRMDRFIRVFNTGAEKLLGYSAQEVVGRTDAGRFFEPSQLGAIAESLKSVLGRSPSFDEIFVEVGLNHVNSQWTLVRKDKSTFTASVVLSPLMDLHGQPDGFLAIFQDISRQKEYEASLHQAMLLAEQSSVFKSQFLANMSHEIRTPMNAILGMLQLLNNTAMSVQQKDYATKTQNAAKSLLGLLNDILDFSKVEAGKMLLDHAPFAVSELLDDLSVILSANLGAKNVDLLFDMDPALPKRLVGDVLRIKQVLINLGGNAVKFTEQGQVVIGWRLIHALEGVARVEVSVRDSGIGIAAENQARIFEAFTQAEASTTRRFGGTGLGLVISTRLVRLMGSDLELQSALGQGSVFSFVVDFPIATAEIAALPMPGAPLGLEGAKVLVVDDNPVALRTSAAQMRELGWEVLEAGSGADAIALVNHNLASDTADFDAIFVDWQMPAMDGWETLKAVRRSYGGHLAPILVMMSGQGQSALNDRSGRDRDLIDGFMVKPLTSAMFFEALERGRLTAKDNPGVDLSGSAHLSEPTGRALAGMRLLVVEDNAINQQVARELLESQGARVTLADNGQQGVDAVLAANPQFHVVLMDLQMPVMDGLTACRTIRAYAHLRSLPVIAISANAMASDRQLCLEAGMTDHVGKPFDLPDLIKVLLLHANWIADTQLVQDIQPLPAPAVQAASLEAQMWPAEIDVLAALRRMGGNTALLQRTYAMLAADANALVQRVRGHLSQADFEGVARELHTLKGLAGTLGMQALGQQAAQAEGLAKQQIAEPLQADVAALETAMHLLQPLLLEVAQRLGGEGAAETRHDASQLAMPDGLLGMLETLHRALQEGDMESMEIHAHMRSMPLGALESVMEPLDAAMANLDFDQGALECANIIQQFTALVNP